MFYSQCLLSRKGPLGAIWVAAYFFKKLRKAQVTETDIRSSVDKILQDELNVVTYRVLAYLLLGVVRIYSKKVEYLFDDCHEVLIKINNFVLSTKDNAHVETLCGPFSSVTLPEGFELDAFDLEILDDVSGGNVVPREEITLKDGAWGNSGGQYSLDKEISAFDSSCSTDYTFADNVLSSGPMDINMEVSTSHYLTYLEAHTENLQDKRFSRAECVDLEMFYEVEEESMDPCTPFAEDHHTNGENTKVPAMAQSEDKKIPGEASTAKHQDSRFSQEGCVNLEMYPGTAGEPLEQVNLSGEDHEIDGEQTKVLELAQENQMHRVISKTYDLSNLETSMEKLRVDKLSQEECMDLDMFCGAKEESPKLVRRFNEEHHADTGTIEHPNLTSSEDRKCQVNTEQHPLSIWLDGTPPSKFPDASGEKYQFILTPATREGAWISRKRKCLIDETIVLPNEVLRQSIRDASDLVSKRRKSPHNALAVWKATRISCLPQGFLEPSIPCISSELRSLFYTKKLKNLEVSETMDKPEKLDMQESPTVCGSGEVAESPTVGRSEQIAIAPKTPVKCSTLIRSFESPENAKNLNSEGLRPASSFGSGEKEPSPSKNQELDLSLMNEEISSSGADNMELYGWSGRTRIAAGYLYKNFLNGKKGRAEEVVSFLWVLEGRTKKESARLFYEILVLRTTGYVDVKQDNAYGDIQVWKLPKWDRTCGAVGP